METNFQIARPAWAIDRRLADWLGEPVRVAAEAFVPRGAYVPALPAMIPTGNLILPDSFRTAGPPVYFEGRLEGHVRRVGVVEVTLGEPPWQAGSADGLTRFRGGLAVILPGPALVRLAFPFQIERLPADEANYWRDLQLPGAQLEWSLITPTPWPDKKSPA